MIRCITTCQYRIRLPAHQRAFTLFEAMLAVGLLATAVAAIAQVVTAGQMQAYDSLEQVKATALAQAMMEEVLAQPYFGPGNTTPTGPTTGLTRATYNCIGNYNGFSQAAGSVSDSSGAAYSSDYQVFSRSVSCTYNSVTLTGLAPALSGITLTVTVSDGHGHTWALTQFVPQP